MTRSVFGLATISLFACATAQRDDNAGEIDSEVTVMVAAATPADGVCTHITLTRLSDFSVSEFKGRLDGAAFSALAGDSHVTATAYPAPCPVEPAQPPWRADEQLVELVTGQNILHLHFSGDAEVVVDPTFEGQGGPIAIAPGSLVRTGRNGEDAAGPNFSLDGFEVKAIGIPPAAPSETVLFSVEGKGPPYSPRGMAVLPDGRFVFQVAEMTEPLHVFDAAGNHLATWPQAPLPAGAVAWSNTDGMDAIDATHLVRTGFQDAGFHCDTDGENCSFSGLDIVAIEPAGGGFRAVVAQQIFLPSPAAQEYAVGVTAVANGYVVATLPDGGTRLTLVGFDGAALAQSPIIPGDIEGLFSDGAGRIVAVDYAGRVTTYNADLTPRAGETAAYLEGVDVSNVVSLAWRDRGAGSYLGLSLDPRLVAIAPDASSASTIAAPLANINGPSGIDYRSDTDEVLVIERLSPIDPVTHTRLPLAHVFDAATGAPHGTIALEPGAALPLRGRTIAFAPWTQQLASHYRHGAPDPGLDAIVFVHNLDGTLVTSFNLRPFGFTRVDSVNALPGSQELAIAARDITGVQRLVITALDGTPHRSLRLDSVPPLADIAAITSGPFAGALAATVAQPSQLMRLTLP
jgi:DNA-binding beta-propeller fold protein YncE